MPVRADERATLLAELDSLIALGDRPHPVEGAKEFRPNYLKFIQRFGFSSADVEGPHSGYSEEESYKYARTCLDLLRKDPKGSMAASIAWTAHSAITGESNDNFLLDDDARRLTTTGLILKSPLPDFEIGIFPMYSSGAEVTKFEGKDIVLLDTGLLRLIRYFCTVLLGNIADTAKAPLIWRCVDEYVRDRKLLSINYEAVRLASKEEKWGLFFVNEYQAACRQFLVAHEVAHIILGHHFPYQEVNIRLSDGSKLNASQKTELSEFEADASAITLQLASAFYLPAEDRTTRRRRILMAIAGPATVFALFLMFEFARRHHKITTDQGHPHASLRIGMLFEIAEYYGQSEHCWLARRATELAHVCCEQYYPEEVEVFKKQRVSEANFTIMKNIMNNVARNPLPRNEAMSA